MSSVVLSLGGVPFQDFEVPEKIAFGGAQRVAVHALIGGGRVVDALGEDDGEISFSGIFSGAGADARAQTLDAVRAAGLAVPMVWDSFFYTVIIAEYVADYRKPWWIPFALRCVVVSDPLAALAALVAPAANLITGDLAAATGLAPQAGVSLGLGVPSTAGFAAAQAQIAAGISGAGATVAAGAAGVAGAIDAPTGIAALNAAAASAAQLAALTSLGGYVNRAAANFANGLL